MDGRLSSKRCESASTSSDARPTHTIPRSIRSSEFRWAACVRSFARYYNGPGSADSIRIDIPVGSYVPAFSTVGARMPVLPRRARNAATDGDDQRIAVLPIVNMSADQDNQYFCDGLTEELINHLAQIRLLARRRQNIKFPVQRRRSGHPRSRPVARREQSPRRQRS